MESSNFIVGIDLGTTNSCIAVKRHGRIEVVPNHEGHRTTLSFVYYGKNNNILVGKTGKHEASTNPTNGIYEIKRVIGCFHDDPEIENERHSLTYNLARGTNGEILIEIDQDSGKVYILPEEVCARILHRLKTDAESFLNQKITKAVITVPAYFNNNQRAATRDAARIAGLEVIKLLNEPSAAALAHIHNTPTFKERTILIYDFGGGTFDVSIVRTHKGNVKVLSVAGNTHLGGQDFLNRLVEFVVRKLESEFKIKVRNNRRYLWKVNAACEKTKKILTTTKTTTMVFDFGREIQLEVSRQQFEEINEDLFKETIKIVDTCIRNRRLSKGDIDEVLLVGGSSRIPRLETLLKEYFNNKLIQRNINAEEAIAVGAALEADFISKNTNNSLSSLLIDVLPLSIGTVFDDETIFFNFVRNTPLPANCRHNHVVKSSKRQKQCILSVYEGEDLDCRKNVLLGAHEIKWTESTVKNRKIEITMQINACGIIWVTAKGESIRTFSIVLNKGRLEEEEIVRIREAINGNKL